MQRRVGDNEALAHKCSAMARLIEGAVENVGRIITDLRPSILDHQGLLAALEWQIAELSGGMKQRVGIARAFCIEPKMLLLDEPFGALDALTRGTIQDELLRIVQATHQTVFMITHDVDEAMLLADRILLMSNGPRAQIAEIVQNTMPSARTRNTIHHDPQYYKIRNHLVDFLVNRSKQYQPREAGLQPPTVQPGLDADDKPRSTLVRAA